jgi:hypothetical protein
MSSGTSAASTTNDFKQAFDNLDPTGRNWVIFRKRFTITVKPVDPNAPTTAEIQSLKDWWEREDFAMYLITQKVEDSTLRKAEEAREPRYRCQIVGRYRCGVHAEEPDGPGPSPLGASTHACPNWNEFAHRI